MSDAYTTRKRVTLIEPGTRPNTWGIGLNAAIQLIDDALGGWLELGVSTVLTSVNGATDQARMAMIRATAAITITVPSVQGWYWIDASNGDVVVTNGSNSVTVKSGNVTSVRTNGSAVYQSVFSDFGATIPQSSGTPTTDYHLTNKAWVSSQIAAASFAPGGAGSDGQFLKTVGTSIAWANITTADVGGLQAALDLKAPLASPALTGTPTAPTAAGGTNTTQIATTAFVAASYAPLASPALTGTPTAPTAPAGTNTTQVATTAFVQANGLIKAWALVDTASGLVTAGSGLTYAKNGIGDYRFTFSVARANTNYAVFVGDANALASGLVWRTVPGDKLTTSFDIECVTPGGSPADPTQIFVQVVAA